MRTVKGFWMSSAVLVVMFVLVLPLSGRALQRFDAFYVFGDSLADNGNDFILTRALGQDPPVPPSTSPHRAYFDGRFSNGPVAFEYLWERLAPSRPSTGTTLRPVLQLPGPGQHRAVNFAFGGSGTGLFDQTPGGLFVPGVQGQVEAFRATLARHAPRNALYAIFTGAGDYLRAAPRDPAEVVANISRAVERLHDVGARNIMVLNLPDLGAIPMFAGTPQSAPLSALSFQHNMALAARLDELAGSLRDINLIAIDVNSVLQQLPPEVNVTLPAMDALVAPAPGAPPASLCLFVNPATCPDVPTFDVGLQYLFWDAQHPTTEVHRLLAEHLYNELAAR